MNAVGAFTPNTRELPSSLIGRARCVRRYTYGALSEAGDLLQARGRKAPSSSRTWRARSAKWAWVAVAGRRADDEVTVYKSVGAAFLDAATARLAYEAADPG